MMRETENHSDNYYQVLRYCNVKQIQTGIIDYRKIIKH